MNSVLFINPDLYRSAEGIMSLLSRFNLYGKALQESSQKRVSRIVLLAGISKQDFQLVKDLNFEWLKVVRISNPTKFSLLFSIKARKVIIHDNIKANVIVSSDLYFGFITSYLISKLVNQKQLIQISIHGTLVRTDESLFPRIARQIYLKFVIRNSQSIRFVSDFLMKEVGAKFPISNKETFIAPIPTEIGPQADCVKQKVLGFVGRVHPERGVNEWTEIALKLLEKRTDFAIKVIGDGPLAEAMKLTLTHKFNEIEFLGWVDREKMTSEWNSVKVFLSSAQSEGYGLAIREALASSTFVCARDSGGLFPLTEEYSDVVKVYRDANQAVEIIDSFLDKNFPPDSSIRFRSNIQQANLNNMNQLVSSWL